MPRIFLPSSVRDLSAGVSDVELAGTSVEELIRQLDQRYPGIAVRLLTGGELRPGWSVSIGGRVTRAGLKAKVREGDEVHFVPAAGGG